jgi:hypothetical protein
MTWRCVLPGCSETGVHKDWWFNHIKQHDPVTRKANLDLLINYGYKDFYGEYPLQEHLCTRLGCPFGTRSSTDWVKHLLLPHENLPCSIPECKKTCGRWDDMRKHLAADHSRLARNAVRNLLSSQGFRYWESSFTCPVVSCRQILEDSGYSVRRHCQKHDFATLLSVAESLVNAWCFTFGSNYFYISPPKFNLDAETISNKQIFACLAFPDAELSKASKPEDLDRMCQEKGIDLA